MLKSRKALSLTTMVITVMIMFIIMGTLVYSAVDSVKIRKLNKLYNDLRQLSDAVEVYSLKNGGELPVDSSKDTITLSKNDNAGDKKIGFVLKSGKTTVSDASDFYNPNDFNGTNAEYKYLKLSLIKNLSLNYTDDYIINTKSHTIYYYTGLTVGGETYNYLPLTYTNTNYGIVPAANSMKLKVIDGVTDGNRTIYFSPSSEQINLKDVIEFDSEENDGLGEPQSVNFSLNEESKYYTLDKETGVLARKSGVRDVSNITSDYTTEVTVNATNFDSDEVKSETFTIATSSINICSTNSENSGPIENINLVVNEDNDNLVYKKVSTDDKEIKIEKNGFLRTKNSLEMIPTAENNEIVSATYNNDNKTKYVVVNSGSQPGTTDLTLEVQDFGLAKDTVTVNVFSFELFNEADEEKTNINKIDFSGLGENQNINLKLSYQGPEDFRFDGGKNKLEWSIVKDNKDVDNSGIINLSPSDYGTNITLSPQKIGKTNLRCIITVDKEVIAEMMIPITVSGLERVDGEAIKNDTIDFKQLEKKSVELVYNFGKEFDVAPVIETPTVMPSTEFKVTRLENNKFKVEYIGNSDVTAILEIIVRIGNEEYKDSINITVSK